MRRHVINKPNVGGACPALALRCDRLLQPFGITGAATLSLSGPLKSADQARLSVKCHAAEIGAEVKCVCLMLAARL